MIEQLTQGIKISVRTEYVGTLNKDGHIQYTFAYTITIENQSKDTVQLISRCWKIKDSLNDPETVMGEAVIGKKPILLSGEKHSYTSGCLLNSTLGAMSGHFYLVNFRTSQKFKVPIPLFNLSAPILEN